MSHDLGRVTHGWNIRRQNHSFLLDKNFVKKFVFQEQCFNSYGNVAKHSQFIVKNTVAADILEEIWHIGTCFLMMWWRTICWLQVRLDGDVTLCCGMPNTSRSIPLKCNGTAGICQNFYDMAPSGRYGTMSYLCKSLAQSLEIPIAQDGSLDCQIQ